MMVMVVVAELELSHVTKSCFINLTAVQLSINSLVFTAMQQQFDG